MSSHAARWKKLRAPRRSAAVRQKSTRTRQPHDVRCPKGLSDVGSRFGAAASTDRRAGSTLARRAPDAGDRVRTALRRFRQLVVRSPIRRQAPRPARSPDSHSPHRSYAARRARRRGRRELLRTIPFLHDLKAVKQADLSATRDLRDQPLHFGRGRAREHPRSVLQDPSGRHRSHSLSLRLRRA